MPLGAKSGLGWLVCVGAVGLLCWDFLYGDRQWLYTALSLAVFGGLLVTVPIHLITLAGGKGLGFRKADAGLDETARMLYRKKLTIFAVAELFATGLVLVGFEILKSCHYSDFGDQHPELMFPVCEVAGVMIGVCVFGLSFIGSDSSERFVWTRALAKYFVQKLGIQNLFLIVFYLDLIALVCIISHSGGSVALLSGYKSNRINWLEIEGCGSLESMS